MVPCSFPDNSLFRLDLKARFFALSHSAAWSYLPVGTFKRANSLYFSLITGNLKAERGSRAPASTASQSCVFSLLPPIAKKHRVCGPKGGKCRGDRALGSL